MLVTQLENICFCDYWFCECTKTPAILLKILKCYGQWNDESRSCTWSSKINYLRLSLLKPRVVEQIERIQNMPHKAQHVSFQRKKNFSKSEQGMPTLKHRRRGDLIEAFKMMNGSYDRIADPFFNMQTSGFTKGHSQKRDKSIYQTPKKLTLAHTSVRGSS